MWNKQSHYWDTIGRHPMKLTYRSIQPFCAGIDVAVDKPLIDLSQITGFSPYGIVYLGMYLRYHNNCNAKYFRVCNMSEEVEDYLSSQNFWKRFNFQPSPDFDTSFVRTHHDTRFGDIVELTSHLWLADEVEDILTELLRLHHATFPIAEYAIAVGELVDNFVQHAGVIQGAMMVEYNSDMSTLSIALGDYGKGIRQSLFDSGNQPGLASATHADAIEKAFQPGVTGKKEGGMGFTEVQSIVTEHRGTLFLSSFDGAVILDDCGMMYKMKAPYSLPGVQIELTLPAR